MFNIAQHYFNTLYHFAEQTIGSVYEYSVGTTQTGLPSNLQPPDGFPDHALVNYKKLCNWKVTKNMKKAKDGRTEVYYPSSHPEIILKKSGELCETRLRTMREVKETLDKLGCSHLIIPNASHYEEFLIEERLPINTDPFHNMHCYTSAPHLFDEAVREMVKLSSKYYLQDLVSGGRKCLQNVQDIQGSVRYDNLPLYVVTENGLKQTQGMIGLIDLEEIKKIYSPSSSEEASEDYSRYEVSIFENNTSEKALLDIVRIFPYHYPGR